MKRDPHISPIDDAGPIDLKPAAPAKPRAVVHVYGDVTPEFLDYAPQASASQTGSVTTARWKRRIVCVALLTGMICVTAVLGHYGHVLRGSLYASFPMLRHQGDVNNAFNQGRAVNDVARELAAADGVYAPTPTLPYLYRGWVKRVDDAYEQGRSRGQFALDYVPLRLLAPALWVRQVQAANPAVTQWGEGLAFTSFMLNINTALGALSALAMFLLVRHWVLRAALPEGPSLMTRVRQAVARWRDRDRSINRWALTNDAARPGRLSDQAALPLASNHVPPTIKAWALGWFGAMLVWFEPNVLLNAHVWPQWDLWIVPFYLLAVWLASGNRWFCAGLSLGIGVMLKGQLLFGVPVLLMWPLFDARLGAAARLVAGFACAFLAIASPWLLPTSPAVQYVALVAAAGAGLMALRLTQSRIALTMGTVLAMAAIVVPMIVTTPPAGAPVAPWQPAVALAALVAAVAWLRPGRALPIAVAAAVAGSVVLAALAFGGTWSWWHIGFGYGTHHYQRMYMGGSVNNLSALLADVYRWELHDEVFTLALPAWLREQIPTAYLAGERLVVSIKLLQTALFLAALPPCAWAAARHARRNDPRFLVAITAPWVICFAVMPQMHERYLFWAAVIAVTGVGVSLGMTLLWAAVSAVSFGMILAGQLPGHPDHFASHPAAVQTFMAAAQTVLPPSHPGIGWLTLLLAAVYLCLALTPTRPRKSGRPPVEEPTKIG